MRLSQDFQKEVCIYQLRAPLCVAFNLFHTASLPRLHKTVKEKGKKRQIASKDKEEAHVQALGIKFTLTPFYALFLILH